MTGSVTQQPGRPVPHALSSWLFKAQGFASPASFRALNLAAGLGAAEVVGVALRLFRHDAPACHQVLEASSGKLLAFWMQKARVVLDAYPAAVPAVWKGVVEALLITQQELGLVESLAGGGNAKASDVASAMRRMLLPSTTNLALICLNTTAAEDQLRVG